MREELDVTYDDSLRKNEKRISELEDELENYRQRVSQLSQDKEVLEGRVHELSRLSRSGNSSGLAHAGGEGAHQSEHWSKRKRESSPPKTRHSPAPHRQTFPAPPMQVEEGLNCTPPLTKTNRLSPPALPLSTKGKGKRTMYDTDSDFDSKCEGSVRAPSLTGNEEELEEASNRSRHEFARRLEYVEGEDPSSSSRMVIDEAPLALRIESASSQMKKYEPSAGSRRTRAGQFPPGYPNPHLEDPASFRLNKFYRLGAFGHVCLNDKSYWDRDASSLWAKRPTAGKWFWQNGRPMQMAREASKVPFDQRSNAQRWAVKDATMTGLLPFNDLSEEPDIEEIARRKGFPPSVQ